MHQDYGISTLTILSTHQTSQGVGTSAMMSGETSQGSGILTEKWGETSQEFGISEIRRQLRLNPEHGISKASKAVPILKPGRGIERRNQEIGT